MKPFVRGDLHITLYLTDNCNMQCRYCYEGIGSSDCERTSKEMTYQLAIESIDYLVSKVDLTDVDVLNYGMFGGEVLINMNRLSKVSNYIDRLACSKKYITQKIITTNGTLLTRENHKKLVDHNIYFAISLDGTLESHDKNRLMKDSRGSFKEIWKNEKQIMTSIENGQCVSALMTITPSTVFNLYRDVVFLMEKGFDYIRLNFTQEPEAEWGDDSFRYLEDALVELVIMAWEKEVALSPFEVLRKYKDLSSNTLRCGIGEKRIVVSPEGMLLPCLRFQDNFSEIFSLGNIKTKSHSAEVLQYFINLKSSPQLKCWDCYFSDSCLTYCPYLALLHGDIYNPPEIMCKLNKLFHSVYKQAVLRKECVYDRGKQRVI